MAIGNMKLIVSDQLPRSVIGSAVKPIMPHPIAAWIERLFTGRVRPVMMVRTGDLYGPCASAFYLAGDGALIVSRQMMSELLPLFKPLPARGFGARGDIFGANT